jgi:hypothetical protein
VSDSSGALETRLVVLLDLLRGHFRITEMASDLREDEGMFPLILKYALRTRCKINFAMADVGEHEGRYPLILK